MFHVTMTLIPLLLFVYEALSLIKPLRCSGAMKTVFAILLLTGALKEQIFRLICGEVFMEPELPRLIILGFAVLFSFLVVALPLLLTKDVIRTAWKVCVRVPFPAAMASAVVFVLAGCLTLWGTWEAVRVPDVRRRDVVIMGLPEEFDGMTAAVLVDLHSSVLNQRPFVQAVVDKTNALGADIVLMPGDFVDGPVARRKADLEPLTELSAPLGVFGSSGNHEYYSGYGEWKVQLEDFGIKMLDNEHVVLERGSSKLIVAGVPDPQGIPFGFERPDVRKALDGAPDAPVILLSHRPGAAREYAAFASLQLSGHTHGGQVPIVSALTAKMNGGFVRGWYDVGDMKLFNSPGTSQWSGFALRLFDPAEITLLTLRRG